MVTTSDMSGKELRKRRRLRRGDGTPLFKQESSSSEDDLRDEQHAQGPPPLPFSSESSSSGGAAMLSQNASAYDTPSTLDSIIQTSSDSQRIASVLDSSQTEGGLVEPMTQEQQNSLFDEAHQSIMDGLAVRKRFRLRQTSPNRI